MFNFQKNIDLILILSGLLVGLLTPVTILQRADQGAVSGGNLLRIVFDQPVAGLPAVLFAIAGYTLASVGLNGLRGRYVDGRERQEAIGTTAILCSTVCGGVCIVLYGLSTLSSWIEYRDVRIAATILGALGAYQLVSTFPSIGNDQTLGVFMGAGALLGYCAAPLFILVAIVAGFTFLGVPLLSTVIGRYRLSQQAGPIVNSPSPVGIGSNEKQINDLRQKIAWVKQSGVAPHLVDEEVARLSNRITKLGGTP